MEIKGQSDRGDNMNKLENWHDANSAETFGFKRNDINDKELWMVFYAQTVH
jgi:hypothetical protein